MGRVTQDEIAGIVIAAIASRKSLESSAVTLDSTLVDLGIDSLDGIDLIFSLEEQFNVTVDDETARGMNTVGDIVRTIQALAAGSGQGDAADATGRD